MQHFIITDVPLLGTLWAFGGTDTRHVPVTGAFADAHRQSEPTVSEANVVAEYLLAANAHKRELN